MENISRRNAIKAGVAGGGLLWAAPAIRTAAAHAAGSPQPGTGSINGQVTNAQNGLPIAGATVTLDGVTQTTTDANGFYNFSGVPAGPHGLSAAATGFSTQNTTTNVPAGGSVVENFALVAAGNNSVSVVMSWGASPSDLDLHMSGPDPNAPGGRFHVAYYNQNPNDYVHQDVDDVNGNGPETDTVTISAANGGTFVPGDYHIWVHNYAHNYYPGQQNFAGSGAKIVINGTGGPVATHLVSNATGDPNLNLWQVADFTLDAAGTITLGAVHQVFLAGNESTVL
jgi:hypothetical protein